MNRLCILMLALTPGGSATSSTGPAWRHPAGEPAFGGDRRDAVNILCVGGEVTLRNTRSENQTVNYAIRRRDGTTIHASVILPPLGAVKLCKSGDALSAWIEP